MLDKIAKIEDSFRGLWKTREMEPDGVTISPSYWSVTFIHDGQYVETPYQDSPEAALDYVIQLKTKPEVRFTTAEELCKYSREERMNIGKQIQNDLKGFDS